jgi:tripeptide aminopeptidase
MMENSLPARVLDLAVEIQQVAAPTFHEHERAAFLYKRFKAAGLVEVEMDELGNVFARLPGQGKKRPLVVSAHSDTVFPHGLDLAVTRRAGIIAGPGIGDNSLGVAGLFGLLWACQTRRTPLPGDLWLVANVCEEGLGNLRGMKAVVERFGDSPLGYIVLEGMALGQVYHFGLEVQRYRICIETQGGHSWVDYGKASAVHELARLVQSLAELELPREPRTTLNVGVISGGTSVNTIAAQAQLELDLRSEDGAVLQELVEQVQALVQQHSRPEVRVTLEMIGQRKGGKIDQKHPLVRLAVRSLEAQGITARFNIGSTDANIPLNRGLPAVCIGLSTGAGAHTREEYINTEPLQRGLSQLVQLVEGAFRELS